MKENEPTHRQIGQAHESETPPALWSTSFDVVPSKNKDSILVTFQDFYRNTCTIGLSRHDANDLIESLTEAFVEPSI